MFNTVFIGSWKKHVHSPYFLMLLLILPTIVLPQSTCLIFAWYM